MFSFRASLVVAVSVVIVSCGKKQEPPAATGSGSAGSAITAPTSGSGSSAVATPGSGAATVDEPLPPVATIDEAPVRAVIDAWLAAQNAGAFDRYQALYADKMEGIKRVGPRVWRFDHAGWLADRGKMFKHPMTVSASDLVIHGGAAAPTVEFVQSFKQGRFSDQGTKHIVMTRVGGQLLIAREEMLHSTLATPAATPVADTVSLVIEIDGRYHVMLASDVDRALGSGRIEGPFSGYHKYALQAATKAPPTSTGKAFAVYAADGSRCEATVGAVRVLGGGSPHFGEVQGWDNQYDMGDGHVWSRAERARAVFAMGSPYLVGELAITGGCKPIYAVEATRTAVPGIREPAEPTRTAAAIAAFRKLPRYLDLQDEFKSDFSGVGPWIATPDVTSYLVGSQRYVVVSGRAGSGCGDFLGELFAVFTDNGGALTLLSNPDDTYLGIESLVDSDGDGTVEAIGAVTDFSMVTGHYSLATTPLEPLSAISFPFNDCGC
jgi:ketosteroid isomerase-like protein